MSVRNPLNSLPAAIRSSCVFCCAPQTGTLTDWVNGGAQLNPATWRRWNGRSVFNTGNTNGVSWAANAAWNIGTFSILTQLLEPRLQNSAVLCRKTNTNFRFYYNNDKLYLYDGTTQAGTGALDIDGSTTQGVTLTSGQVPKFYLDGVFAEDGSAAITPPTASDQLDACRAFLSGKVLGVCGVVIVFNRELTPAEMATVHAWSESIKSPSTVWPGMGAGRLSRPSTVPFGTQQKPSTPDDGADVVADGDMEAVGTASWTAFNAADLAKVAGSPSGSGTQAMRVTRTTTNDPAAQQDVVSIGTTYRCRGWARGDGSGGVPELQMGAGVAWSGTNSTSWQYFDVVHTCNATGLRLQTETSTPGAWTEWDDVTVVETRDLVSDGAMEATGTEEWTSGTATPSKVAGARTGGTGSLILRVAGGNGTYNRQLAISTVGVKYRVLGWARSLDGVTAPSVTDGLATLWTGTISTSWQYFDEVFTATDNELRLYNLNAGTGSEWDDVSLIAVQECQAAWDFADAKNGVCVDRTGNGHDGTIVGGAHLKPTPIGNALQTYENGAGSGLDFTASTVDLNTNSGTVVIEFAVVDNSGWAKVLIAGHTSRSYIAYVSTGGYIELETNTGADVARGTWAVDSGVLHQLVATATNKKIQFYLDGVALTMTDDTVTNDTVTFRSIGYGGPGSLETHALIKSAEIHNHPFDATEIARRYKEFATIPTFRSGNETWPTTLATVGGAVGQPIPGTEWKCGDTSGRWDVVDDTVGPLISNNVELVTDGDMEAAGTTAYTAAANAVLTKESGSPGGSGSQVLRMAHGGSNYPYAYQNIMTAESTYRVRGYARGDGTAKPSIRFYGTDMWVGTTSTSWQEIDFVGIAPAGDPGWLSLRGVTTVLGTYVEFDDLTCQELTTNTEPTRVIECKTAGLLYMPSDQAYGTWEWSWKKSAASNYSFNFGNQPTVWNDASFDGYLFQVNNAEALALFRITGGSSSVLTRSLTSYIAADTWYQTRITRSHLGVFSVYIRGGIWSEWTLTSSASAGTNPTAANLDHTTCSHFVAEPGNTNHFLGNFRRWNGVVPPV